MELKHSTVTQAIRDLLAEAPISTRTRSRSVPAVPISVAPAAVSIVRAAIVEKTQLHTDTSDEGESEYERLYVCTGDNEWMLRSDYEDHIEDDEGDESAEGDIDAENEYIYMGDNEWILRTHYEEVEGHNEEVEEDEEDEEDMKDIEEGFGDSVGDSWCMRRRRCNRLSN